MWIRRSAEPTLSDLARTRPVVVLTGARQTGKTSLLRHLFPGHRFVSLDLPSEAEQAEKEPGEFLRRWPAPLIVDEVQYAPELFRHLKSVVDAARDRNGQYLLTGSQRFTLMQGVTESLAGRVGLVELETLALPEIAALAVGNATNVLTDTLWRGGFPELHANRAIDPANFYASYISTYLERDVRSLSAVGSLRDFERFLRACALRSANLLNKAELARDVGIAPSTANQWLSILQASGHVILLEPWFSNRTRSIVKSPKLYFADTGLLCALLNIQSTAVLLGSPLIGAIFETYVFQQLRHRERYGAGGSIWFWRDRSREVDFVVDRGGRVELVEAKFTELPSDGDASNLRYVQQLLGDSVSRSVVACRAANPYPLGAGVQVESPLHWATG